MDKVGIVFFAAWLLCGCSVEKVCDDWKATVAFVAGLIVVILAAAVLAGGDK